ncbi:hypothetical protein [Flavobacterium chungangense]|uniref:hypothetical protein n=1 Tax=Flavobacterium chungangense TaxID=554283 RepID=UPI0004DF6AAD|nr:hypothetical protein [Flavobacterium chungangense]
MYLKEVYKKEKFEKFIQIINLLIRAILVTSSLIFFFTLLFIFLTFIFKIKIESYSVLYEIYMIFAFGSFYSIIFGIIPVVGVLILTKYINRKQKLEIFKIRNYTNLLLINAIFILVYILSMTIFLQINNQY